jgi:hypothetical protein
MVGQIEAGKSWVKFPRVYNATNLGLTANVTLQPGSYQQVTKLKIGAKQVATWGIGNVGNGVDSREPAYIKLCDSADAAIDGTIRLSIADANFLNVVPVIEQRSERFYSSINDKSSALLIGEYVAMYAGQDSYLLVEMYIDASSAKTIVYNATSTKIILPITVMMNKAV